MSTSRNRIGGGSKITRSKWCMIESVSIIVIIITKIRVMVVIIIVAIIIIITMIGEGRAKLSSNGYQMAPLIVTIMVMGM